MAAFRIHVAIRRSKWKNSTGTATYFAWRNMRRRCTNPADASWEHYGGRGIKVCPAWESYDQFVDDMGLRPAGMTLDRINTDGDYEPANCAWVSLRDNLNNRRNTVKIADIPVTLLSEKLGIKADTLRKRLHKYNTPLEKIYEQRLNVASVADHGTRIKYERDGCRCDECRTYNTERARIFREKRRQQKLQKQGENQ